MPPPVQRVDLQLDLGGETVDLATRALAAAVVSTPRYGREGEVLAGVAAARQAGAALADVSLEPRLIGPAVQRGGLPVVARTATIEQAEAARAAGIALVLVTPELGAHAAAEGWPTALVVDDVGEIDAVRAEAERHGFPLAIDTTHRPATDALAQESVAVASGCRIVRTTDVRRTRRVIEVVAAVLEARRED